MDTNNKTFHELPDYKDLESNYKRWNRLRRLFWIVLDIAAAGIIAGIIKYIVEK